MKTHLIDKSNTSLHATVGTACGIRLQLRDGSYFAAGKGTTEFTLKRIVVGAHRSDEVTCAVCRWWGLGDFGGKAK